MKKPMLNSILISTLICVPFMSAPPLFLSPQGEVSKKPLYGTASWYSRTDPFIHRHAANGEVFDDSKHTCASWDFPFGTYLKVINGKNGKSVICRVNDRGPAKYLGRRLDLTESAFRRIADLRQGLVKVVIRPVKEVRVS